MTTSYYYLILIFCCEYFVELSLALVSWISSLEVYTHLLDVCTIVFLYIINWGFFALVLCLYPSLLCVFPTSFSHILSYTGPVLIYLDTHTHTPIWIIASSDFLIYICLELTLYCLGSWSWAERRTGFVPLTAVDCV